MTGTLRTSHGLDVRRIGKLIVAAEPHEIMALNELERRAKANGAPDVRHPAGHVIETWAVRLLVWHVDDLRRRSAMGPHALGQFRHGDFFLTPHVDDLPRGPLLLRQAH